MSDNFPESMHLNIVFPTIRSSNETTVEPSSITGLFDGFDFKMKPSIFEGISI
jgi:hypothetical protein